MIKFRRFNLLLMGLILLLIFLQYRLWFQPGGMLDLQQMKKELAVEQILNTKLKDRNQMLLLQVQQLQNNENAVESRARQELGMIKKDEVFYQVVKK